MWRHYTWEKRLLGGNNNRWNLLQGTTVLRKRMGSWILRNKWLMKIKKKMLMLMGLIFKSMIKWCWSSSKRQFLNLNNDKQNWIFCSRCFILLRNLSANKNRRRSLPFSNVFIIMSWRESPHQTRKDKNKKSPKIKILQ